MAESFKNIHTKTVASGLPVECLQINNFIEPIDSMLGQPILSALLTCPDVTDFLAGTLFVLSYTRMTHVCVCLCMCNGSLGDAFKDPIFKEFIDDKIRTTTEYLQNPSGTQSDLFKDRVFVPRSDAQPSMTIDLNGKYTVLERSDKCEESSKVDTKTITTTRATLTTQQMRSFLQSTGIKPEDGKQQVALLKKEHRDLIRGNFEKLGKARVYMSHVSVIFTKKSRKKEADVFGEHGRQLGQPEQKGFFIVRIKFANLPRAIDYSMGMGTGADVTPDDLVEMYRKEVSRLLMFSVTLEEEEEPEIDQEVEKGLVGRRAGIEEELEEI